MSKLLTFLKGITGRVTTLLVLIVSVSILITATLGYFKLYQVTAANSEIRIDRAARAATALFAERLASEFTVIRDEAGTPLALRLKGEDPTGALTFRDAHDALLKEIGAINQGAANLFRLNPESQAFDRFATTFRRPDGSMPPPMSIGIMHPAYDNLINNRPHLGEVPVMGRMRLAYLTPIQTATGSVAGALAVDVGWVDDLVAARNELRRQIIIATGLILVLVAAFGAASLGAELKPLRALSRYAEDLAAGAPAGAVPYRKRNDEIGALAQGLERVVALQGKLAHLAYTDPLTGLANRSRHLNDLDQALSESLSGQRKWTLLHIDLDKFKQVNDGYGQSVGDRVIKLIAARIKDTAGDSARIARLAADHFAVLIGDGRPAEEVETLAEKLLTEIHEPLQLNAGEIRLTGSIGIVLLQHDASDADEAHRNAGLALRKAKAKGDRAVFFSSEMLDDFQNHMRIERMLRLAIADREIEVHFQPQVNPATHQLAGVEALARWTHPAEGPISPGMFIPIAEASGQIVDLGTLILELACEQAAKWRAAGFGFRHISINVSPIQLWQPNFIEVVKDALKRHDLAGNEICIEITEGVFVDQSKQRIEKVLAALRQLGVLLSLDDFGSGYSSLGYLNRLPFDQLKVDRSFVSDIDTDVRKQKVMRGILELGRGLGFDIVVEGAETLEEVTVIRDIGCDAIQGYYYSRLAPALLIPEVVKKIQRLKPSEQARTA
ncbi:EAL domain-containing protein [Hoeflea alexandrii]|uniref:putative bifunctional diguanylate cyclase/phosphodiesterase n=1 Tax=Hoeflea alexandrii TaxID=288436 RepID=UPI0022706E99|nr:EAL domain-containing protein [Hoeflea alexandrii]MCY0151807.1 EAL domain-containing protein [Hoeflea alexandrii]